MLVNEKQQSFIQMRVVEGKSFEEISKAIDTPVHILKEWSLTLIDLIEETRLNEIDRVSAEAKISSLHHYRNLADIYKRLKSELDKRDFSGLPTDKLYFIFNDVQEKLSRAVELEDDWDDFDDEYDV